MNKKEILIKWINLKNKVFTFLDKNNIDYEVQEITLNITIKSDMSKNQLIEFIELEKIAQDFLKDKKEWKKILNTKE